LDTHILASASDEGLGSKNVLDFTSTDTESEGTKGTVRRGMTVTTNNSCSRESEALLWTNDMNDTLALIPHSKICETEILHVLFQGGTLKAGVVLFDEFGGVLKVLS
jgi:hypothetical protein